MIKIEIVLDILKKDGLFREIIDQGHYHFNYSHVVFDTICYDSRKAKEKIEVFSYELLAYRTLVNAQALPDSDDPAPDHCPKARHAGCVFGQTWRRPRGRVVAAPSRL